MTDIVVPDLGEGIEKATVSCWYFKVGDQINEGEDIVELVTDKISPESNVLSPESRSKIQDLEEWNDGEWILL